jgi:hypothetical protein
MIFNVQSASGGAIDALVERTTRYKMPQHLADNLGNASLEAATKRTSTEFPADLLRSFT